MPHAVEGVRRPLLVVMAEQVIVGMDEDGNMKPLEFTELHIRIPFPPERLAINHARDGQGGKQKLGWPKGGQLFSPALAGWRTRQTACCISRNVKTFKSDLCPAVEPYSRG